ncbi:MAG: iron-sulfur cluster assembly scaffold protein [Alphaproteobacteria bacterium]|nr:iron-sulfur cluster assembly scaffold protein [Alphaproteobacteria bacterium]
MELSDLYSQRILEIAGRLGDLPPLADADARAKKVSRVCGSTIEVAVKLENGKVSAYSHEVNACALGQTSASVMAEHILGATPDELRQLRNEMVAMLKDNGQPPSGERWVDLRYLEPVRAYRPRHTSTLLVFEAVVDCLDQIDKDGQDHAAELAVSPARH